MFQFKEEDSFFAIKKSFVPKQVNKVKCKEKNEKIKTDNVLQNPLIKIEEKLVSDTIFLEKKSAGTHSEEVIFIEDDEPKCKQYQILSELNRFDSKEIHFDEIISGKRNALCDVEEIVQDLNKVTKKQRITFEKSNNIPRMAIEKSLLTPFRPVPGTKPQQTSIVAIDCEMVNCEGGIHALARCSIVDYNGHVLYDKIIKPKWRITNYLTFVSGITPVKMKGAPTYDQCIGEIIAILHERIVVGHSIRNDFDALNYYPKKKFVRDLINYKGLGPDGKIIGLKKMTEQFLGMHIQDGQHNSVEDARATMALYRIVETEWENEIKHSDYGVAKSRLLHDAKRTLEQST